MATNLRAYRDGNRLVLVIENPTKDLESIVGALISGEVNPVKDLTEPKPMAKPKVDVDKMQEVAPKPEVSPIATVATPVNQEHKKAPFVKKLEEQQAAAKADAERPVTTQVKQQAPTTAMHAKVIEKAEGVQATAVRTNPTAAVNTKPANASAVSNAARPMTSQSIAKPQTVKPQMSTANANSVNAKAKPQVPTTAVKPQPTAKQPNAGATTAPDRSALIKKVWGMRANAKVKALLKAKYQDENYDIRRLSTAELTYLSKL